MCMHATVLFSFSTAGLTCEIRPTSCSIGKLNYHAEAFYCRMKHLTDLDI